MTLARRLASFAAELRHEDLPEEVAGAVRRHLLDLVGVALAAHPLPTSGMALRMAESWGGPAEAGVLGTGLRLPAASAAFANGVLAHSLDFDDTHLPSILHPSACVLPAALAVAEAQGADSHRLIAAAAAGYEVGIRTAMAGYDPETRDSVFFRRGWHATSVCGTLAAATVAAVLYGLDAGAVADAVGIAASMAGGILEGNRTGGTVKRLHCGWACHAGILAAQAARAGITGPPTVLEGRFGLYEAFCGGFLDAERITEGLGERWSVPSILFKPYPANHFAHAGIDAALALARRVAPDEIEEIELRLPPQVLRTLAEPREAKLRPATGYEARFSGPFTVAAALLGSGAGLGLWLDDLSDRTVEDPRYLALAARVTCLGDPELERCFPQHLPAVLRVRLRGGGWHEERVLHPRGSPGNPLRDEELTAKFLANARLRLSGPAAERLAASLLDPGRRPVAGQVAAACPEGDVLGHQRVLDSQTPER